MADASADAAWPEAGVEPKSELLIPMVVAVGSFMQGLDSTVITTAIPNMAASLGVSPLRLSVAITSYLLSLAVFTPISGWVADRFGTRNVFCASIALFTLGSALCGMATSLPILILTRVVQGLGGALMIPVARLILARAFPREKLMTAMAYMAIPAVVGPTIGPLVGGFFATYATWRWIFYINIPIGLLGIFLTLRHIENVRASVCYPFDVKGFFLVGGGLVLFELAIEQVGRNMVSNLTLGGLFLTATTILFAYYFYARRRPRPVMDLRLFRIRPFRIALITGTVTRATSGAIPFLLPLLLQLGFGLNPLQSGWLTFTSVLAAVFLKPAGQPLLRWMGFRRLLIVSAILMAAMIAGFACFHSTTPHIVIALYLFVFGFIRVLQNTVITTIAYADLTHEIMSQGTTIASIAQQLSQGFGVAVAAALLALTSHGAAIISTADFPPVFIIVGLLSLGTMWGFLRLTPEDGALVTGAAASVVEATD